MAKRLVMTIKVHIDTRRDNRFTMDIQGNRQMPARQLSEVLSTLCSGLDREGTVFEVLKIKSEKEVVNG
ncbi:hypothetical protein [Mariniradius saccharolyticus]|nr:hypothetical protein [Mariniradius saccharolyticus]